MKRACVLISGGMDSAALLWETLHRYPEVHPVYIRCGLRWEKAELHGLRKMLKAFAKPGLKKLVVLKMDTRALYGSHWSRTGRRVPGYASRDQTVYLPGRNLLLLSLAAIYCASQQISDIFLGTLGSNPFPDGQSRFFAVMEKSIRWGLGKFISIRAPFSNFSKEDLITKHRDLPWSLSFSCLSPKGMSHCGRCNKCAERDRALLFSKTLSRARVLRKFAIIPPR